MTWLRTNQADPAVARLADDHYSRKHPGARLFCPPGHNIVLYLPGPQWPFRASAAWVWWYPPTNNPAPRMDGFQGWWNCSLFRNEQSEILASDLIKEAVEIVDNVWGPPQHGYDTYVQPHKLRGVMCHGKPVFGWCYRKAGWVDNGHWSKDGKKLRLFLPRNEAP